MKNETKGIDKNIKHEIADLVNHFLNVAQHRLDRSRNERYIWFIAGFAIGIFSTLIFTPKKGSKLRKEIKNSAQKIADDAGQKFEEADYPAK